MRTITVTWQQHLIYQMKHGKTDFVHIVSPLPNAKYFCHICKEVLIA